MVERIAEAVREDGVPVNAILALTFTEKAAGELAERLRRRLTELGEDEHARAVDGAWIGTIHGFCARLLRAQPLAAGLDPRFEVLEQPSAERLAERRLRARAGGAGREPRRARRSTSPPPTARRCASSSSAPTRACAPAATARPRLVIPPPPPRPTRPRSPRRARRRCATSRRAGGGVRVDGGRAALEACGELARERAAARACGGGARTARAAPRAVAGRARPPPSSRAARRR